MTERLAKEEDEDRRHREVERERDSGERPVGEERVERPVRERGEGEVPEELRLRHDERASERVPPDRAEEEVRRDGHEHPDDDERGGHPTHGEVLHVLDRREPERGGGAVDDPIDRLVELLAMKSERPRAQELGAFFAQADDEREYG